jgi:hypothetical protein
MVRFIPKQFAENSTTSVVFGSFQEQGGNVGDGTISSDPATLQGGTAWPLGWSAATDNFFKIPRGEEMEGLERVLSAAIIQQFTDGLTFWQPEMPVTQYQTIVQYQTGSDLPKLYINITGTSTSTPPDSDTTNWYMFLDTGNGGVSRNIGEIVVSTVPLVDAGLHLADGALISGSGSYVGFVTYMAGLVSTEPDLFTTEADWQSAISTYGVCGKYVYDSVNNTIRLPKYDSKIYTKSNSTTALVKGSGKALGLTNGTENFGLRSGQSGLAITTVSYGSTLPNTPSGSLASKGSIGVTLDATNSGLIADLSGMSATCDVYYYVVIATSTKTDIQVDIDEIATDLNGKADVDAGNFNATGRSFLAKVGLPDITHYDDLTLGVSGTSYIAPANGYFCFTRQFGSSARYLYVKAVDSTDNEMYRATSCGSNVGGAVTLPVIKGTKVLANYDAPGGGGTDYFRFIYAIGEN